MHFNHKRDSIFGLKEKYHYILAYYEADRTQTGPSFDFHLSGIVLIDEIETHLHLELQKNIMPLLTAIFSNIQFIVTSFAVHP